MKQISHTLQRYFLFWSILARNALQEAFVNRWTNSLFFTGKAVRFAMMIVVLFIIKNQVRSMGGYTSNEIVVFFLTYQFLDTVVQIMYRGVYLFDTKVRSGEFDFYLLNPINALFRALLGKPDLNDVVFLIPSTLVSIYIVSTLGLQITPASTVWFLLLLFNSFLIATALHVLVLCLGVVASEVQSAIWLYRDITRLGQFPVVVYGELLRFALFFVIPVGLMVTVPAELLLHRQPSVSLTLTTIVSTSLFAVSLRLWHKSLKKYTSASS